MLTTCILEQCDSWSLQIQGSRVWFSLLVGCKTVKQTSNLLSLPIEQPWVPGGMRNYLGGKKSICTLLYVLVGAIYLECQKKNLCVSFGGLLNTNILISLNKARVLNWTWVNLPIQIEKFKSFKVSISTLSRFEPGWLQPMKLIKPQGLNWVFKVYNKNLYLDICSHFLTSCNWSIQQETH